MSVYKWLSGWRLRQGYVPRRRRGGEGGGCGGREPRGAGEETRGRLRALGEACKAAWKEAGRGFTGRNRCLLSAPAGLACNNRPVTLRKCRRAASACASAACLCVYLFARLLLSSSPLMCANADEAASAPPSRMRISQARGL